MLVGLTIWRRTQVEVDPNVGLLGFETVEQLRKDYAWAIDIQPCVFLQEGWTDVPGDASFRVIYRPSGDLDHLSKDALWRMRARDRMAESA